MPSNRELATEARELGRELGEDVDTGGLNNKKLVELVQELRGRRNDEAADEPEAEVETAEPEAEEPEAEDDSLLRGDEEQRSGTEESAGGPPPRAPKRAPKHALEVAANKAVKAPRGMLRQFEEVRETDFDAKTLDRLLKIGCVVRK